MFWLKLAVAGIGHGLLHYGIGFAVIAICLLVEYFSVAIGTYIPFLAPLLERFRKDILWVALLTAFGMAMMWVGGHDNAARCDAKAEVVNTEVTKQVTKAKQYPVKDKWDHD